MSVISPLCSLPEECHVCSADCTRRRCDETGKIAILFRDLFAVEMPTSGAETLPDDLLNEGKDLVLDQG